MTIVTHHPLIFKPIKSVTSDSPVGDMLLTLAERGISLLCAHTNLDAHPEAISAKLAADLGLLDSEVFLDTCADQDGTRYGFGMMGSLAETVRLDALVGTIKKIWDIPCLRVAGRPDRMIRNVAFVNGSGARYLDRSHKGRHIDAYITGDCGHHDFDNANRLDVALIDAGHYETEKYIPEILADALRSAAPTSQCSIRIASSMRNPFNLY